MEESSLRRTGSIKRAGSKVDTRSHTHCGWADKNSHLHRFSSLQCQAFPPTTLPPSLTSISLTDLHGEFSTENRCLSPLHQTLHQKLLLEAASPEHLSTFPAELGFAVRTCRMCLWGARHCAGCFTHFAPPNPQQPWITVIMVLIFLSRKGELRQVPYWNTYLINGETDADPLITQAVCSAILFGCLLLGQAWNLWHTCWLGFLRGIPTTRSPVCLSPQD